MRPRRWERQRRGARAPPDWGRWPVDCVYALRQVGFVTIALLIKVNDGLVLASDSATTLSMGLPDGSQTVVNTYDNANKVFNLHKGLPIGAMTWGLGNIGPYSIATLAKDLRRRFHGQAAGSSFGGWDFDEADYTMELVRDRAYEFLHDERYADVERAAAEAGHAPPSLGFLVAGYSSDSDVPKAFVMNMGVDGAPPLAEVIPEDAGAAWWGQPEAIHRILVGMSLGVPEALVNLNVGLDYASAQEVALGIQAQVSPQLIQPAMPIQDAIDLAEFLVHATIQYVRFSPGPPTVGGPIEIATITKHEGFRWVRRKHFFRPDLNPPFGGN